MATVAPVFSTSEFRAYVTASAAVCAGPQAQHRLLVWSQEAVLQHGAMLQLERAASSFFYSTTVQQLSLSVLLRLSPGYEWIAYDIISRVLLAPPSNAAVPEDAAFLPQDPRFGTIRTSLQKFLADGPLRQGWQTQCKDRLQNLTPVVAAVCLPAYHTGQAR